MPGLAAQARWEKFGTVVQLSGAAGVTAVGEVLTDLARPVADPGLDRGWDGTMWPWSRFDNEDYGACAR